MGKTVRSRILDREEAQKSGEGRGGSRRGPAALSIGGAHNSLCSSGSRWHLSRECLPRTSGSSCLWPASGSLTVALAQILLYFFAKEMAYSQRYRTPAWGDRNAQCGIGEPSARSPHTWSSSATFFPSFLFCTQLWIRFCWGKRV